MPMINKQLQGKNYFCGDVVTCFDLQIFCELKSIRIYNERLFGQILAPLHDVAQWIRRLENIPEISEIEGR